MPQKEKRNKVNRLNVPQLMCIISSIFETGSLATQGHFFPLLQKMAELCQNRKWGKMGRVRLNSPAQCGLGGVPVSEDTGCLLPPCEALKRILYCVEKNNKVEPIGVFFFPLFI